MSVNSIPSRADVDWNPPPRKEDRDDVSPTSMEARGEPWYAGRPVSWNQEDPSRLEALPEFKPSSSIHPRGGNPGSWSTAPNMPNTHRRHRIDTKHRSGNVGGSGRQNMQFGQRNLPSGQRRGQWHDADRPEKQKSLGVYPQYD